MFTTRRPAGPNAGPKIRRPHALRIVTSVPRDERTEIFLLVFAIDVPELPEVA